MPHLRGAKATNAQTRSRGHQSTPGVREAVGGNDGPSCTSVRTSVLSTRFGFLLRGLQCPTFLPLAAQDRFCSLVQNKLHNTKCICFRH